MNAEQVINKILSDAKEQADAILNEAARKRDQQARLMEEELSAYRAETHRLAAEAAEDRRSRMLAAARMENARAMLATKVDLLDEVFRKARQRIIDMPDEQYKELVMRLMQRAVETGDEEVVIGTVENRITEKLIKDVNRLLGPGYRGNLHMARDRADISGGFILRRGKIQVNVSVEVLVERAREQLEMEITEKLFGDDQTS